ncbi:MAG: acryloyl-CoA reductase, partial [Thermicanus sp.]|nr:acryloyl-CoA reductase [Thermicanus sp.]
MDTFRAYVVDKQGETFKAGFRELTMKDLPEGEVLIRVTYSSVNYKDGLASIPDGHIVRTYPFVPGIDLTGEVVSSVHPDFQPGMKVIVTGYELGVSHFGGFSRYARVPAAWIVPLPETLTMREAMTVGTAGFTAALSVLRAEENGLTPHQGPVLVTGATGGVGSMAVAMLANKGYEVWASTGKKEGAPYLQELGAKEILDRSELMPEKIRPLDQQRFAGVIDSVGGKSLAYLLSATKYGGIVTACGLTGGSDLPTTVFPFILRGVSLLGIDSVYA